MKFECVDTITHPKDEVYLVLRDQMIGLLPYLHDVESIQEVERKEEDGGIRILNLWQGSPKTAPAVVRKFLKPELLSWKDHAFWTQDPLGCTWRLEPKFGGSLFSCTGSTTVLDGPSDDACLIKIAGDLEVYPEKFPGVPKLLARKLRPAIESFIVNLVTPNMKTMARGVQQYVDDRAANQ